MRSAARGLLAGGLAFVLLTGLTACVPRSDEWSDVEYAIASGGSTGVYYDYGSHLAEELSDRLDLRMVAQETAGSVDNLLRVSSGEALLGFAQGDAAADAVSGTGAFERPLEVEALARLYDEYVQVVVRGDSDIDDIGDLAGRTISLGAENSGVNVIAGRVLDAAGVALDSVRDPQLDLSASIGAMERGEIDGFFWVGGLPTPGVAELSSRAPVRLLPIEPEWVNAVNERYSHAYRRPMSPRGHTACRTPRRRWPFPTISSPPRPRRMPSCTMSWPGSSTRDCASRGRCRPRRCWIGARRSSPVRSLSTMVRSTTTATCAVDCSRNPQEV